VRRDVIGNEAFQASSWCILSYGYNRDITSFGQRRDNI
jgi:hypothetical protein